MTAQTPVLRPLQMAGHLFLRRAVIAVTGDVSLEGSLEVTGSVRMTGIVEVTGALIINGKVCPACGL